VLSGLEPADVMVALDRAVRTERRNPDAFSSALCAVVSADRRSISFCVAGHPAPVLIDGDEVTSVDVDRGPLLGVMDSASWPVISVAVGAAWSVVLYTDGLVEGSAGRRHDAGEGEATLRSWIGQLPDGAIDEAGLTAIVSRSRQAAGGILPDDVAIVAISRAPSPVADDERAGGSAVAV
jgi:serine phosphatase RsbU (regulator of sigma subunit)